MDRHGGRNDKHTDEMTELERGRSIVQLPEEYP